MPWNDLSYQDLTLLLHGPRSDGGRPYMRRKRRLSRVFLDAPTEDTLYEMTPEEWMYDLWERYSERCRSRRILLYRGGAYHTLPYLFRGHPLYRQRQEIKVDSIKARWPPGEPGCLLTISPRWVGSPIDILLSLRRTLNGFLSFLSSRKRGNRCKYIWAIEPGKRTGHIHLHIILCTKWVASIDNIALWFQGHGMDIGLPGLDIRRIDTVEQAQSYVMKYITKGLKDHKFQALLYLTGSRAWGASRSLTCYGLVRRPLINSNEKWAYLGAFPSLLIIDMLDGLEKPPDPGIYTDREGRKHNIFTDFARLIDCPLSHIATGMDGPRKQWRP